MGTKLPEIKVLKLKEELMKVNLSKIPQLKCGGRLVKRSKKGSKLSIKIKPENKGKFTDYCGGKVTSACIAKGKKSPNPKIRKRATFAANARKWNSPNS